MSNEINEQIKALSHTFSVIESMEVKYPSSHKDAIDDALQSIEEAMASLETASEQSLPENTK